MKIYVITESYTGRYIAITNDRSLIKPLVKEYGFHDDHNVKEVELNEEIKSDKELPCTK